METWSVMARGWESEYGNAPMNGRYVAISMEELLTVDVENVDSREPT
jgi:hypothetical protein